MTAPERVGAALQAYVETFIAWRIPSSAPSFIARATFSNGGTMWLELDADAPRATQ